MRAWLLKIGEPVPSDSTNVRLLRMGILADQLVRQGHEVSWWTSTFDHRRKCQRFVRTTTLKVRNNYEMVALKSPGYSKNISLQRIIDHEVIARKFERLATRTSPPDVIVAALPTLELGRVAADYARIHRVPFVVDVRDMWPDVFERSLPRLGRVAASPLLRYFDRMARRVCSSATAITGHTECFVEWGLQKAGRSSNRWDRHFPFAYPPQRMDGPDQIEANNYWSAQDVIASSQRKIVSFVGTLSHQFAIGPVIEAARQLDKSENITFVIAGDGEKRSQWMNATKDCPNIIWPGWIDAPKIQELLNRSTLALAPYHSTPDFIMSIPNKVIEYLASGTPVLTSLDEGRMHELLNAHRCGISYSNNSGRLASLIKSVVSDQGRLDDMASNAKQLFQENFSADKVYGEMVDLLGRIVIEHSQATTRSFAA